jgi:hypothetical protein
MGEFEGRDRRECGEGGVDVVEEDSTLRSVDAEGDAIPRSVDTCSGRDDEDWMTSVCASPSGSLVL